MTYFDKSQVHVDFKKQLVCNSVTFEVVRLPRFTSMLYRILEWFYNTIPYFTCNITVWEAIY